MELKREGRTDTDQIVDDVLPNTGKQAGAS